MKKLENFSNCLEVLKSADFEMADNNDIYRTGVIGQFNLTFELAWKALQEILKMHGADGAATGSPREILQLGYKLGFVDDAAVWLLMLKKRNTSVHIYNEQEVDEFLDIIVDDYEDLVRDNRELAARVKELEEKLAYFDEMKESLSQSVILAQETAEKVKASAADESANLINKANFNATHLVEEAKSKASEILRDATDEAKRVAIETEELKRQSRVFHQRLLAAVEGQLSLASAPEWGELLQPTAIYLQNSDAAFKEVVEKVLDEHVPDSNDAASFDATRQFTPDEMAELQRRVAESNKQVEDFSSPEVDETNEVVSTPVDFGIPDTFESEVADFPTSAPVDEDFDLQPESTGEINLNETQTFKLANKKNTTYQVY